MAVNPNKRSEMKKPICIPAGGQLTQLLPPYLLYAPKVELVPCPYDRRHLVKPSKLRGHIIKCERTHPKLSICYYNATHRMPAAELPEHVRWCPSRMDVAPFDTSESLVTPPSPPLTPLKPAMSLPKKKDEDEDEYWD